MPFCWFCHEAARDNAMWHGTTKPNIRKPPERKQRLPGASFTKQLSKNLGLSSFLSEKFTHIPCHKILSLNLRYFMKLAPGI